MSNDIVRQIVEWLKSQLQESHTKGFVLGLSGGLDSAVCAALIRKATENCLGLILPIESDVKDLDDAATVASAVNIKTQYIDLTTTYKNLIKLLPDDDRLALGNLKARLRMIVLYYYANLNNYFVCGTGNKTEISLGYFTKYGDGACDLLPIGDLYKTEVRELAHVLEIPETMINKVPSAGLWAGQTDEGEIGFPYCEIDKTLQALKAGRTEGHCAERIGAMIAKSEHKRKPPKICTLKK
jgi:NAD+ synthase